MFSRLSKSLERRGIHGEVGIQLYLIPTIASLMCLLIHFVQMLVFMYIGINLYVIFNLISIFCYMLSLLLCNYNKYVAAVSVITCEVCVYAFAVSLTSGVESYILCYYIFTLVLQMIMPYRKQKVKVTIIVCVLLTLFVNITCSIEAQKVVFLKEATTRHFMIANILIIMLGVSVCLFLHDLIHFIITQMNEKKLKELTNKANKDALTGLYNRHYVEDVMFKFIEDTAHTWCVAMLDIDDFKNVNDTYGHDVGDMVLVHLANWIQSNTGTGDLVVRWGGEEILLLINNKDVDEAKAWLEMVRFGLYLTPLTTETDTLAITFTAGISKLDKNDVDGSIKRSDINLYFGKHHGKNQVIV